MGLMSYLVEGFDPDDNRDVVFVPVAINYDRVLEDLVLIAADKRGDRRFGARITVVLGFILRKLWQRLTRQETRFGTAAVAFGEPLSLRGAGPAASVEDLSEELMARIARTMPVLAVPVICRVLLQDAPVSHDQLIAQAQAVFDAVPQGNRVVRSVSMACLAGPRTGPAILCEFHRPLF